MLSALSFTVTRGDLGGVKSSTNSDEALLDQFPASSTVFALKYHLPSSAALTFMRVSDGNFKFKMSSGGSVYGLFDQL